MNELEQQIISDYIREFFGATCTDNGLLMLVVNVKSPGTKLWAFGARISFPRGTGLRSGTEMSE